MFKANFNFLYNSPLEPQKFEDSEKILKTCFGSNSVRIPFLEANFFLNERYFRRLYLEVGRGSFGFLNHEKFHNNLNKSCKICNLKKLQFNRIGLILKKRMKQGKLRTKIYFELGYLAPCTSPMCTVTTLSQHNIALKKHLWGQIVVHSRPHEQKCQIRGPRPITVQEAHMTSEYVCL